MPGGGNNAESKEILCKWLWVYNGTIKELYKYFLTLCVISGSFLKTPIKDRCVAIKGAHGCWAGTLINVPNWSDLGQ